ncbi:MAG: hypothetical protein PHR26_01830 [Candidatus ainarchaeum sp.]|nr:hypothetical protein [Candidatus ainarchaeum sp.]
MNKNIIYIIFIICFLFSFSYVYAYSSTNVLNYVSQNKPSTNINPNITISANNNISNISQINPNFDLNQNDCGGISFGDVYYPPGICSKADVKEYTKNLIPISPKDNFTSVENIWGTCPTEGNFTIPVFMVEFSDQLHKEDITFEDINAAYNDPNYLDENGISVSDYYLHESYGNLHLTFDVYEDWYELPETFEYYKTNNSTQFQMFMDLLDLVDPEVDFSQYDADNDGRMEGLILIRSGEATNQFKDHTRIMNGSSYNRDDTFLGNMYVVASELDDFVCEGHNSNYGHPTDCRFELNTLVHEFGHILGVPDLYEHHNGLHLGMGLWNLSMMSQTDGNPNFPINFDVWSKTFFGWINPTIIGSQDAGFYNLPTLDDTPIAYVLQDETKMYDREYFLVANRFMDESTQDKWMFWYRDPNTPNYHGGVTIYHIDEEYIEDQYPTNSIMWDPDGLTYDDNDTHPGIVYESNYTLTYDDNPSLSDLYTTEFDDQFGEHSGRFDSVKRIQGQCVTDTTSYTYNGLVDTEVAVEALDVSQHIMPVYLQSRLKFIIMIDSPINNTQYDQDEDILFIEEHENPTGQVTCDWVLDNDTDNPVSLSDECDFIATAQELGIFPGVHTMTLIGEDEEGRVSEDVISLEFSGLDATIVSPKDLSNHTYEDTLSFETTIKNNVGEYSCEWKDNDSQNILSNDCEFTIENISQAFSSQNKILNNIFINKTNVSQTNNTLNFLQNPKSLLTQTLNYENICTNKHISLTVTDDYNQETQEDLLLYICHVYSANNNNMSGE